MWGERNTITLWFNSVADWVSEIERNLFSLFETFRWRKTWVSLLKDQLDGTESENVSRWELREESTSTAASSQIFNWPGTSKNSISDLGRLVESVWAWESPPSFLTIQKAVPHPQSGWLGTQSLRVCISSKFLWGTGGLGTDHSLKATEIDKSCLSPRPCSGESHLLCSPRRPLCSPPSLIASSSKLSPLTVSTQTEHLIFLHFPMLWNTSIEQNTFINW